MPASFVHRESPLSEVNFVAFDVETTALFPVSARIVEIGAVRFRLDGGEIDRFEQLVDPQCTIPAVASRIHGITNAVVQGQPTIAQVLPRFISFLGESKTVLLAHNAIFDLKFLGFAMARQVIGFPLHPVIDTLDLARSCIHGSRSYRLEDLAIHLRLADWEDHRGLSDSRLVAGLFRTIVSGSSQLKTLGDLFSLSRPLTFEFGVSPPGDLPAALKEMNVAIAQQLTVLMDYDGGTKGLTTRRVTPRHFARSGDRTYLCAYCHRDHIDKTFRIDRIRKFRLVQR